MNRVAVLNIEEKIIDRNLSTRTFGPDFLHPENSLTTSLIGGAVKLRLDTKMCDYKPVSVYTRMKRVVDQVPEHPALGSYFDCYLFEFNIFIKFQNIVSELDGVWKEIKYSSYWRLCNEAAKSFIKLGLKQSEVVAIIGFNAPAWMISMYGAIFAGYINITKRFFFFF